MTYKHDTTKATHDQKMKRQIRPWLEKKGLPVDVFDDLGPDFTCEDTTIRFLAVSRAESCEWKAFDSTGSEVGGFNDTRTSKDISYYRS